MLNFRKTLDTGNYLSDWKTVNMVPIYKAILSIVNCVNVFFIITLKSVPSLQQVMKDALYGFQDEQLYRRMNSFVAILGKVHYGIVASHNESREFLNNRNLQKLIVEIFKTVNHLNPPYMWNFFSKKLVNMILELSNFASFHLQDHRDLVQTH